MRGLSGGTRTLLVLLGLVYLLALLVLLGIVTLLLRWWLLLYLLGLLKVDHLNRGRLNESSFEVGTKPPEQSKYQPEAIK